MLAAFQLKDEDVVRVRVRRKGSGTDWRQVDVRSAIRSDQIGELAACLRQTWPVPVHGREHQRGPGAV